MFCQPIAKHKRYNHVGLINRLLRCIILPTLSLASEMRLVRITQDFTTSYFADLLGISQPAVSLMEDGTKPVPEKATNGYAKLTRTGPEEARRRWAWDRALTAVLVADRREVSLAVCHKLLELQDAVLGSEGLTYGAYLRMRESVSNAECREEQAAALRFALTLPKAMWESHAAATGITKTEGQGFTAQTPEHVYDRLQISPHFEILNDMQLLDLSYLLFEEMCIAVDHQPHPHLILKPNSQSQKSPYRFY